MFENHSSCFISTIDSILDFKQMERFHNNVYLNWDPNNSYQVSRKKYAGEYKEICDIVKNIHVKDTIYKGDTEIRVPLGKGEVGWEQIFADLIKGEYRGKYTIETHYATRVVPDDAPLRGGYVGTYGFVWFLMCCPCSKFL